MGAAENNLVDERLKHRRQFVTALTRWTAGGLGVATLVLTADPSAGLPWVGLAVAAGYALFTLAAQRYLRRHPQARPLKVAHDVVDALAIAVAAHLSGGPQSPLAYVFYPHVVAVSVRGGLRYATLMGLLDGALMLALALPGRQEHTGIVQALALLTCAGLGGIFSDYLRHVRGAWREVHDQLGARNAELQRGLADLERARAEQEQALAQLRSSEQRYRRLLERIQDGVLIVQDGRVAWCNQLFAEMAGERPDALVGRDFRSLAPPEDRAELEERYEHWLRTGEGLKGGLETRLLTRRNEMLQVSLRAASADFEGRRAAVVTVRDVTRERRMEADVQAHAERLAAVNEIANAVNLNLTIEDILSVAADEGRRLVRFDAVGLALVGEDHPELELLVAGRPRARDRAAGGLTRQDVSWALKRPVTWCRGGALGAPAQAAALVGEDSLGAFASLPLYSKNRTQGVLSFGRRAAEPFTPWDLALLEPLARHIAIAVDNARLIEAVQRRSRELESLLEIGRGVLEELDLDELLPVVTRSVNRVMGTRDCVLMLRHGNELRLAAQEGIEPQAVQRFAALRVGQSLTGWVAEHGVVLAVDDMRHDPRAGFPDVAQSFGYRSFLGVPLRRGGEVLGTLEVLTRERRRFGVDDQLLMSAFADQAAVAIANARSYQEARAHLAEVTAANARLEDLDRLRREYLRNVSHEFRTPLTIIRGYAEYLRDTGERSQADLRGIMRAVLESCERLIDMVDTLLDVSRVEQPGAGAALAVRPLHVQELVDAAVEALRPAAERRGVRWHLELPDEPLMVEGDPGLLQQLVRKLLDNAVKYSERAGAVAVRARGSAGALELEVQDEGIGIAAEHLPRIFDKFYTVDGSLTRRVGGTGVGLYLVREIVRLHHGEVDVTSTVGAGSLFRVRLPLQFGAQAAPGLGA